MSVKQNSGWGNFPKVFSSIETPSTIEEAKSVVKKKAVVIPQGNLRSYGDAALGTNVITTQKLNSIIEFDAEAGILVCESGVLLATILKEIVPKGWFLGVTPGTKFITVGGAVAADVHGKNHHSEGCFSNFVNSFSLINGKGEEIECSATENESLYYATFGAMGSTGLVTKVNLKLKKISSSNIDVHQVQVQNLKEMFSSFEENKEYTYSVAWIDCLQGKEQIGRGVITYGEHAKQGELAEEAKSGLNIPGFFPSVFLNKLSITLFNALYFAKGKSKDYSTDYNQFFYPLDGLNNWNNIYGKNGFIQYQFVLPMETSFEGIEKVLKLVWKHSTPPFLSVLKLMGKANQATPNSFPIEGYTLAMDFKWHPGIEKLVAQLDEIVEDNKGRVYLAKDALSNPSLSSYKKSKSKKFSSIQSERLELGDRKLGMRKAFILGGNSDVAKALVAKLKAESWEVVLSCKSENQISILENELNVEVVHHNVLDPLNDQLDKLIDSCSAVFSFVGYCPIPQETYTDTQEINNITGLNYNLILPILEKFVHKFEQKGEGLIVGVSSVAGERGRASNYLYGSAKAGFTAYLSGIRNRLAKRGVHVMTVLPGFMDTKMTATLDLPKPLTVSAEKASELIIKGVKNKKNILYVSAKWKLIMFVIKSIPEFIFKKLSL